MLAAPAPDAAVLQLDSLVDPIERVDRVVEAVVDLLDALRRLFGGEGGD